MASRRAGSVLAALAAALAALLLLLTGTWLTCGFRGCPDVAKLRAYIPDQASVVLDRRGLEVAKLYRVNRRIIPLDSVPSYVPQAFVAVEDKRFYKHHGVDWLRVPGAVVADLRRRSLAQGFSTITMQLARNLFPDRLPAAEKSPFRKLAEMRVATEIEDRYSKPDILQMYLNQIYFGHGAWGIEAASQEYFGKPASKLTLAEAATLAALPKSPSRENPRSDREAAQARRNLVLQRMAQQGYISATEADKASKARMRLRRGLVRGTVQSAPYFLEEVRTLLETQLGDAIYTQALTIHTTLDLPTQRVAEAELERQLEAIERGAYGGFRHPRYDPRASASADTSDEGPAYLQGALMMLDSQSGDVLAWVGGRDFAQSAYDRVTQARRQPGSAFKPFVYTAAVAAGYPPTYELLDEPLNVPLGRGKVWSPQNYDGQFLGTVPMVEALAQSRNVPTVRLATQVGLDRVVDTAHQMGIDEQIPQVPSMPLGVADVTPYELIDAYTTFSSLGNRVQPRLVTSVVDQQGREVWGQGPQAQPTLDPAVAFVMTSMLQQVVDYGTGTAVRAAGFRGPAAGKTGTTQSGTDAWFIGFTPRVTMGIWMGFDRPAPITSSATGGTMVAPVWGRIMARAARSGGGWTPPPGVDRLWALPGGGLLAGECPPPGGAQLLWFVAGTGPQTIGCEPTGGFAEAGSDTVMMDTLSGLPPEDQAWWDRFRRRIFGGTDTTGATPGAAGTPEMPGTPTPQAPGGTPGLPPGSTPGMLPGGVPNTLPPARGRRPPPAQPGQGVPPGEAIPPDTAALPAPTPGTRPRSPAAPRRSAPVPGQPASPQRQPVPPPLPPDTGGGGM